MINIVELQPEHNESYRKLWVSGITEYPEYFRIAADDNVEHCIPTKFNSTSLTLGAFDEENQVGIVSLERDKHIQLRHKALVFRMFVHPDAAGRGVGRTLLQKVLFTARNIHELKYLYLSVLATNERAISLYSSLGFKEFSREHGGVNIDNDFIDELQMAHQLIDL